MVRYDNSLDLGISELQKKSGLGLYPNPVVDVVHISRSIYDPAGFIFINNLQGQLVYVGEKGGYDADVSHLSQGIYLLTWTDASGKRTLKFIKN